MRLLIIQGSFGAGGAEKIVAILAAHRLAMGDEVHVAGMTMPKTGSFFEYPERVTQHVLGTAQEGSRGSLQLHRLLAIRALMKQTKPDLVVSFLTKINVLSLMAAGGLNLPVAISERNNPRAQNAHPVWRRAQEWLGRRAAAIVMQTERARADLTARNRARAVVIPNPCAPLARNRGVNPGQGVRLAAVGRLDRQKGFDLLLKAMPAILGRFPDTRLDVYGNGPERSALEELRTRLNIESSVDLLGASARPGAWVDEADILVAPSRFEGFPNVVAEATVSGLPVVAFDCDYGPRELIRHGENGLLVATGDVAGLADAVVELIGDDQLRLQMSEATETNTRWLAPEQVLAQWDALIDRIGGPQVGGRPARSVQPEKDANTASNSSRQEI